MVQDEHYGHKDIDTARWIDQGTDDDTATWTTSEKAKHTLEDSAAAPGVRAGHDDSADHR
jgi:hypothetical protein